MKKHHATVAHHVPGRMRLKIPSAKGNEAVFQEIRQTLAETPGIHDIEVNATTGSITVHYSVDAHPELHTKINDHQEHFAVNHTPPATKLDDMTRLIEDEAEFLADHSHSARLVVNFCKSLDKEVKRATGN